MNSRRIATLLNFLLPGAGLLYLGKTWSAVANFILAIGILVLWVLGTSDGTDFLHYIGLAIAAGSAGFAHSAANRDEARDSSTISNHDDIANSSLNTSS